MYTRKGIFFAAALMLLAACQAEIQEAIPEEINEIEETAGEMVVAPAITAVQEPQTKTLLEVDGEGVGTIYWKPADEINVFYGTTSTHYVSQNDANATTAVFTTTDIIGISEGAATNIWGLYPYNSSATCTGAAVTTTLPATQYGVPGTFDDDLFITLAHNNSTALTFYNVCGGIKFSLSRDDITSITFRGNNNEDIAGDLSCSFGVDAPIVSIVNGKKKIVLEPKAGGTFVSGENYYLVLCPVVLSEGFTMFFETNSGYVGTFNYTSSAIEIKRSTFGKKSSIDTYADFVPNTVENLSASGTANCYIVTSEGQYKFKTVRGNSQASVGDIRGVKLLWKSFGTSSIPSDNDIIKTDVSYADGYITFKTSESFQEGNAVIAAYSDSECTDGHVLWSWHIWCTDEPVAKEYRFSAGTMMDRNIGATSAEVQDNGSFGLLFQWGRKDPFLGLLNDGWGYNIPAYYGQDITVVRSDDTVGTILYSIQNPMTYISFSSPNTNYDWYYTGTANCDNTRWASTKTIYDPCPSGWRVPDGVGSSVWERANGSQTFNVSDFIFYNTSGRAKGFDCGEKLLGVALGSDWYPLTGYSMPTKSPFKISDGNARGFYWTCTPIPADSYGFSKVSVLDIESSYGASFRLNSYFRYVACSIRCQKE